VAHGGEAASHVSQLQGALESAAKAAEGKSVTLEKELGAAAEAREEAASRVSQLQGALESAAKAAEGKIVTLEKELGAAVEARGDAESRVSQLQGTLEFAAKAAEAKVVTLEEELRATVDAREEAEGSVLELQGALESAAKAAEAKIVTLVKELGVAAEAREEAEGHVSELRGALEAAAKVAEEKIQTLESELSVATAARDESAGQISELRRMLESTARAAEARLVALKKELDIGQRKSREFKARYEAERNTQAKRIATLDSALSQRESDLVSQRKIVETARARSRELETALSARQADLAGLQKQLKHLEAERQEEAERKAEADRRSPKARAAAVLSRMTDLGVDASLVALAPFGMLFDRAAVRAAVARRRQSKLAAREIGGSPLFDAQWYLKRYPDVAATRMDPLLHYIEQGVKTKHDPGPHFSTSWYLRKYHDVADAGINPLHHYVIFGAAEGRSPTRPPSASSTRRVPLTPPTPTAMSAPPAAASVPPAALAALVTPPPSASIVAPMPSATSAANAKKKGDKTTTPAPTQPGLTLPNSEAMIKTARRKVRKLKARMQGLGFYERGVQELSAYAEQKGNIWLKQLAAWELALLCLDRGEPDPRECLRFLESAGSVDGSNSSVERVAVVRAEAYDRLGDRKRARQVLAEALAARPRVDLFLGMSRLHAEPSRRLEWINKALTLHDLSRVSFADRADRPPYDRLQGRKGQPALGSEKVSIIIPAYNAGRMIGTAIESLLLQTWGNLEILVADDCSTDDTCEAVEEFARKDARVRLIRGETNSGAYVARNRALKEATGAFVTCNDADDWSHPQKIEFQARHLLVNDDAVANTSPQARVSDDLIFDRRGNPGFYVLPNLSSLMFRRELVVGKIGFWDSVRFGADGEYRRRMRKVFGRDTVVNLDVGPLSFQRQTETSLTASSAFGYQGFKMGARREYELSHASFHAASENIFVDYPLAKRPFHVPEPMRPKRVVSSGDRRKFDVILVSDFRLPGGSSSSSAEEIKAQSRLGLKTGLVQMSIYALRHDRPMNSKVAELIDGESVDLLVYGEKASCDLLVLRHPWVLEEWQEYLPNIEARNVRVIVNQPPKRDYGPEGETLFHLPRCADRMLNLFGDVGVWHPIGPLVRDALVQHHADELPAINLGREDWLNIIDVEEWRRPSRPRSNGRVRICRHSRDQFVKWPSDRDQLLSIYPASDRYEICVLGGAEAPKEVFGGTLPDNWNVIEFGKQEPREFLAEHDVFVYFTHPDWVEAFGRVIFEAMAVGLPVILPPTYRRLFQDAAIYAEPHEVIEKIDRLMADSVFYEGQVERARAYVESQFGYSQHEARLRSAMGNR
jgi:glycosyltransferase involved in cell wall biosynthesis